LARPDASPDRHGHQPFIERLIGTLRREYLDQTFFCNGLDLRRKLNRFEPITTSGAFTPDSVVERHSSGAAQVHSNRRIFSTSLGDPTVPTSFTHQLPHSQEFAMVTSHDRTQNTT
jgi:hypothetical protein